MLKYIFAAILLLHGLAHAIGFSKAFGYGNLTQFTKDVSRPAGLLWLMTALLFILCAVLYLAGNKNWIPIALAAILLSQTLIIVQ